MRDSIFETIVGIAVIAIAGFFLMFSLRSTEKGGSGDSYELIAEFMGGVQGVNPGTDVRLKGVKVGVVTDVELNMERLVPVVTFTVANGIKLDEDTIARLTSDGLLGGTHIQLSPGGSDVFLEPGDEIYYTRGNIDFGTVLSEFATGIDGRLKDVAESVDRLGAKVRIEADQE
ncbi:MAG: hypothetical protein CME88_02630 [Hirschia sp.]|nr:hypothetical protein [Hirschia sp.]MBF17259.1 hypothetical protein [Hirschia sp.]|tara:strand:+ start:155 stop:673 length:519 start_codon:yes stop_codon:yes gene_type:complete